MFKNIPTIKLGNCPLCGKPMVKHVIEEGSRFHVHSWFGSRNGATSRCSEPSCEDNHGYGKCVPYREEDLERIRKIKNKINKEDWKPYVFTKNPNS